MILRQIEAEIIPMCEREGVGQVVFSPLAQGVLTGKYRPGEAPQRGTRAADPESNRFMQQLMNEEVLSAAGKLGSVASDAGLSMSKLALAVDFSMTTSAAPSSGRRIRNRSRTTRMLLE